MSLIESPHDSRPASSLPDRLRLGAVELTVSDISRSVAWYQHALGLHVHHQDGSSAGLGDGRETFVVLHEDPLATPAGHGTAGLYHYALLYPTREDLARAAVRLSVTRTEIDGASDHGFHEAIYLPDPDGNGIELAADRAQELWPAHGDAAAARPRPLDFSSLIATVAGEPPITVVPTGVRMGHVHLHVGDVPEAIAFYRDVVGFDLNSDYEVAAFLSAGGYHHHLAVNIWNGQGATAPAPHTAGLRRWIVELPAADDVVALAARRTAADRPYEVIDDGLQTTDPFGTAVAFLHKENDR
jgi:catechol 2,3-dioxygenase